ncbi:hypothetical protein CCR80_03270 [Rhodothalassium salexigens]|uniref:DUF6898 family protein n=1 Tax=Rhodothalassium salexigens TaxID=1086 RepID=UPI0019130805|nr:hypothetical protein [Rhodothalassium salexigens]MBK5920060.1 hypothetical protein [Rhodothalassium salexigens]
MGKNQQGYIIEFVQMGTAVKVSAIDPVTNIEVSTVGSVHHSERHMTNVAVRKLEYRIAKEREAGRLKSRS